MFWRGGGDCHKRLLCPFLNCESAAIHTIAEETSLSCPVNRSMVHGIPPWYLATAWTVDIHLASSVSLCHRSHHGLQWHPSPWTSTWLQALAQREDICMAFDSNLAPSYLKTMKPDMASSGSMDYEHQHGQQSLLTSAWPWVASQPTYINMASG